MEINGNYIKIKYSAYLCLTVVICLALAIGCKKDKTATVTDIDGNSYDIVTIGTQTWMGENLKVTRFRNGDSIFKIPSISGFPDRNLQGITGTYFSYDFNEEMSKTYGYLYNGNAVMDSRQICPVGWHVPSDTEWTTLSAYLGGEEIVGKKLKEAGSVHWKNQNMDIKNEYRFTALPGGYLDLNSQIPGFKNIGVEGHFWESTGNRKWYMMAAASNIYHPIYYYRTDGYSIRCIRD